MERKPLQTTITGSLPKPAWLAEPEKLWSPWKLEGPSLTDGKRDAVRLVLRDQERAGIDIVSDGEQTRQHFVTTFIEHLDGVDFQRRETMRIRDRYDAEVPVVVGKVGRPHPVYVEDAKFLRAQTTQPVKFTLPGRTTGSGQRAAAFWFFSARPGPRSNTIFRAGLSFRPGISMI